MDAVRQRSLQGLGLWENARVLSIFLKTFCRVLAMAWLALPRTPRRHHGVQLFLDILLVALGPRFKRCNTRCESGSSCIPSAQRLFGNINNLE